MTKTKDKKHLARVAGLPCCLCGANAVQVHHIREGQGMGQRASHWLTIPLCVDCHTGKSGIHGDRSVLRAQKTDELQLLAGTIEAIYG